MTGMNGDTLEHPSPRRGRAALGLKLLTVANAGLYFVAASLHVGVFDDTMRAIAGLVSDRCAER
jgi:hypothetical protein